MILTPHAIVGAAVGRLFPQNPILAFIAGFASHFLLDAIPHWHYKIPSFRKNRAKPMESELMAGKTFFNDVLHIGTDCLLGFVLAIYIFQGNNGFVHPSRAVVAGALGGVLPDAFQFFYFRIRREPFRLLQKFHVFVHAGKDIHNFWWGILSSALVIIIAVLISKLII